MHKRKKPFALKAIGATVAMCVVIIGLFVIVTHLQAESMRTEKQTATPHDTNAIASKSPPNTSLGTNYVLQLHATETPRSVLTADAIMLELEALQIRLEILRLENEILRKIYDAIVAYEATKGRRFIGYFEATAYTISPQCLGCYYRGPYSTTATGTTPLAGRTLAVCPTVIPYGTEIYVPNVGWLVAEDTGGALRNRARDVTAGHATHNLIDIFKNDLEAALQWGRRTVRVYERVG